VITADRPDREFAVLSATRARKADQVCDCFEAALRSGQRPDIHDFLNHASEPSQTVLLRELIGLEVAYRRIGGDSPCLSEYRGRFPDRESSWLERAMEGSHDALDHTREADSRSYPDGAEFTPPTCPPGWAETTNPTALAGLRGRRLGRFELLERVGVGAFSSVWRAHDLQLDRVVAVKIPHPELIEAPRDLERIYREARTVAQLRHPGIVSVHEVLVYEGLPILVSDFVAGTTLCDLLAVRRLSQRESAGLVAKVAEALSYAHALGAIHRDIKPANIMLDDGSGGDPSANRIARENAGHEGKDEGPATVPARAPFLPSASVTPVVGEPRIVDFGLAFRDQDGAHLTQGGELVGTPAYMSPEQGEGGSISLNSRADVYSLGVVLYETLSGVLPFKGTRSEILRQLACDEPRRLRELDRTISRDLETICQKAMAKAPRDRYQTARELADDLKRFLDGETIRARPVGLGERAWRYARRRPAEAAVAVMVAVTVLALVGLGVGSRFHLSLRREYDRTDQARRAEARERRRAETYLYYNRMGLAEREYSANNIKRVERLLEDCPAQLRGWEWSYLRRQCHHELFTIHHESPDGQSRTVTSVVYSPDGRFLATSCRDGLVRLWDATNGDFVRMLGSHEQGAMAVAYHPDGTRIASSGLDGLVKVWDVASGRLLQSLRGHQGTVFCVAYSPDGSRLASGDGYPPWESARHLRTQGNVKVWDASKGLELFTLKGHSQNVMGVAFSPDGAQLATVSGGLLAVPQVASKPGELLIWDARTGKLIRNVSGHDAPLTAVAYSPDGKTIATASWDRTARLWDSETGARRSTLTGHRDWVCHVAFDPSGCRLGTAGADGAARIWDIASGRAILTYRGHTQNVTRVAFDPTRARIATASSDQTVKVWDSSVSREAFAWRGRGPIVRLAFFPDSRRLILGSNPEGSDGHIRPILSIVEPATGHVIEHMRDDAHRDDCINGVAVSPDGRLAAVSFADHKTEVRTTESGAIIHAIGLPGCEMQDAAFSPDGASLAVVGLAPIPSRGEGPDTDRSGGYLGLWDLQTGHARWARARAATGKIRGVDFSPDGQVIATADNDGSVTLWDAARGEMIRRLGGHRRLVTQVAFSPDGRRIASASWDQTAKVWDVATGRNVVTLRGHMRSVLCIGFNPDGSRLATGSEDQTVKIWDAATGEEVLTLRGHTGVVWSVTFSPNGRLLASAGTDGTVQVREAEPLHSNEAPIQPSD
jgi:eukaryotic-like serine/threonine-protein kinase